MGRESVERGVRARSALEPLVRAAPREERGCRPLVISDRLRLSPSLGVRSTRGPLDRLPHVTTYTW